MPELNNAFYRLSAFVALLVVAAILEVLCWAQREEPNEDAE